MRHLLAEAVTPGSMPSATDVVSTVTAAFYPIILPFMVVGVAVGAIFFLYRKVRSGAKGRG